MTLDVAYSVSWLKLTQSVCPPVSLMACALGIGLHNNQSPETGWLLLTVLAAAGMSKPKVLADVVPGRGPLPGSQAPSHCALTWPFLCAWAWRR